MDAVVDQDGDVILLSYKDSQSVVTRCNFRGVPVSRMEIKKLPEGLLFGANRMLYQNGLLYFASLGSMKVLVTDTSGEFKNCYDLVSLLRLDEKQRGEAEMSGFSVDKAGDFFFTIPTLFTAYKVSPEGTISSFGKPGSAPGRFGVVAGIICDSRGNVLVVDKLKCAIMVFDKDFNFLAEFGYRGLRPENLIAPDYIAIDKRDRIYVTQARKRGVSVFALTYN